MKSLRDIVCANINISHILPPLKIPRNLVCVGIDGWPYCIVDAKPGMAPDGSCAIEVLAACKDFESCMTALRILSL